MLVIRTPTPRAWGLSRAGSKPILPEWLGLMEGMGSQVSPGILQAQDPL